MKRLARIVRLGLLAGLGLFVSACASSRPMPEERAARLHIDASEPVLLTSSGAFELHVRDGHLVAFTPATAPGETARQREIRTLDELRSVYQSNGQALPDRQTDGTIQVNGWRGLECVRLGEACGPAPIDGPSRVMVVLRFD